MAPIANRPLTLGNLRAAEGPEGPDRPDTSYEPGESATIRFDVSGYDTSPGKGQVRIRFSARDPFDVVMLKQVETIQEQPADEPSFKGWARISLPEYAWPGTYYKEEAVVTSGGERSEQMQLPDVNSRFSCVPRRIPVTNHLTLDGMSPGDYVMTLTFTDSIGNQRHEQPVRFTIQQ